MVRVFALKLKELQNDLFKKSVFGVSIGRSWTIEFQKRGLPHTHILIIVADQDKPRTSNDYNKWILGEIPDIYVHPTLYDIVTRHMMHGPCGAAD